MSEQDGIPHTIWLSSSYPAKPPCATLLEMRKVISYLQLKILLWLSHLSKEWSHWWRSMKWWGHKDRWPLLQGVHCCTSSPLSISMPTRLTQGWWKPWNMQCSLSSKTTTWIWIHPKQNNFSTKGYILGSYIQGPQLYLPEQAKEEIKTWLEIKQFWLSLYCMKKMLQWKIQDLIHQQRRELRIVRMTYCSCLRMLPTQHLNQVRP